MVKLISLIFSLSMIFVVPFNVFCAETMKFKHVVSVYADDKGIGLKKPEGVACNGKSLLIVADTGNGRLVRYTFQDRSSKGGAEIKLPQLTSPVSVQLNSKGEIFALDGKQRRIVRLSPEGEFKSHLAVEGSSSSSAFIPKRDRKSVV
jgi:sugar lactone lactonase YvrE